MNGLIEEVRIAAATALLGLALLLLPPGNPRFLVDHALKALS